MTPARLDDQCRVSPGGRRFLGGAACRNRTDDLLITIGVTGVSEESLERQ